MKKNPDKNEYRADRTSLTEVQLEDAYSRVHTHGIYDLEVDTTRLTPEQGAVYRV